LADPFLVTYIRNQTIWVAGATVLPIVFALAVALLMNRRLRLRWLWRAVILVPWVMPPATIAVTWRWIYDQQWGLLNHYLVSLGLTESAVGFLTTPDWVWPSILLTATWMWFPYNYVVLLASLQSVPAELYDAARIDGATRVAELRFITLPLIRPVLLVLVTLGLIWSSNDFATVFLLTQGGPGVESMTVPPLIFRTSFRIYDIGRGAAIGVILMLSGLVFVVWYLRRARREEPL
jgi:multiple sugar transport system permease protein